MAESLLVGLLLFQGVLGGVDTLLNHELIERLPYRKSARTEVGLHALREGIYGSLFAGLAWFAWHGILALVIAGLLLGEVAVTASLNLGFIIAALAIAAAGWSIRDFLAWRRLRAQ